VPRYPKPLKYRLELGALFNAVSGPLGNLLIHVPYAGRLHQLAARKPHVKAVGQDDAHECPCKSFRNLDRYWTANSATLKPIWDAAVKRPGLSGYQLFMDENLHRCHIDGKLCSVPSSSGGFNFLNTVAGTVEVPPGGDWIGKALLKWACSGAPLWDCVMAPFGTYDTYEDCMGDCWEPAWSCSGDPDYECFEEEGGEYASLEDCEAVCWEPAWSCSGDPDYECFEEEGGAYASLEDCEAECWEPAWSCSGDPDYECVEEEGGAYSSLEDCEADCWEPAWHCSGAPSYTCSEVEGGEFSSLAACQAACHGPLNTCNSCSPKISDTLYVTISGLGGTLASLNGKHTLHWYSGCVWATSGYPTLPAVGLSWVSAGGGRWTVSATKAAGCLFNWVYTGAHGCHPETGGYVYSTCTATGCSDSASCTKSVGATAVVSLS
jgi:hypothetical protein